MDAKLFLLKMIEEGATSIPEGTTDIEMYATEVNYFDDEGGCIDWLWIDNAQIAYDTYEYDFNSDHFTVEEFEEWKAANPNALTDYYEKVKSGVELLAGISAQVNSLIRQGREISESTGTPFELTIGVTTFDVRKIEHVDWCSSSMYC